MFSEIDSCNRHQTLKSINSMPLCDESVSVNVQRTSHPIMPSYAINASLRNQMLF
ncbi:hypothetical protein VFPPC_16176 [Pochonia chlamydosporia 170]|uniref:Uncharacterized protein n=1 Tax=Pochonia chlamydosporia 170 TaxID=1380566 RepID=A0A179FF16_METCM|nr:hypothetical protein VFPPC_16176 [Pochonia chlamydosporia 170]OAQ64195.1 hypothetical protein VFPPC_16176 [Pochonia chlamydosporia 170]